ncbi:MAG: sulfite exporter TauE/SafE family protein [Actinomycetota bacterium]
MAFTAWTAVWLVALGVGVGAFGTIVGAGGGFILTPILLLLYPHDPAKTITAISLTVVFFNALSGSIAYGRQKRIDYRAGIVFALATLPGAIGGALLTATVPRRAFDVIMACVLLALGVWILVGGRGEVHVPARRLRLGALYSLGVGFVSSFLGIGGGIIHVPLLVRALGFPTHVATATSHFVLAIMGGAGAATHAITGGFAHGHGLRRSAALSGGVVVGAQLGARISVGLRDVLIQRLLAAALLALAVRLIV